MNQVKMYLGAKGVIEAYESTLSAKEVMVVCLSNNYSAVVGDYFDTVYVAKQKELGIKTREILPDTPGNREYAKQKDAQKNQVRFLAVARASESDLIFIDDKVIMVSFEPEAPWAMEITDANVVSNLRNQYEELWKRL